MTTPTKDETTVELARHRPASWRANDGRVKNAITDAWMAANEAAAQAARARAFMPGTPRLPHPPVT